MVLGFQKVLKKQYVNDSYRASTFFETLYKIIQIKKYIKKIHVINIENLNIPKK